MSRRFLLVLLAFLPVSSFSASFDCKRASTKTNKLICSDAALSRADEELMSLYNDTLKKAPNAAQLRAQQFTWLTTVRNRCSDTACLTQTYAERKGQLTLASGAPGIVLTTLEASGNTGNITFLFAESNPPEIGQRINAHSFPRILKSVPKTKAEAEKAISKTADVEVSDDDYPLSSDNRTYSVIWNAGNLLVLEFNEDNCAASCSRSNEQDFFDRRTGRAIQASDLFSHSVLTNLGTRLKQNRLRRAKEILAAKMKSSDKNSDGIDGATSEENDCLSEWEKLPAELWPLRISKTGTFIFKSKLCPALDYFNGPVIFNDLDVAVPANVLKGFLTPYGKSVLFGEGDVREPSR